MNRPLTIRRTDWPAQLIEKHIRQAYSASFFDFDKQLSFIQLQGRYGMLRTAVHIRWGLTRLFHNN